MRVGLTTGDPNGIGVETILKTFEDDRMFNSIITGLIYFFIINNTIIF